MIEHQRVQRYEPFDAALVQLVHRFGQLGQRETDFCPSGKVVQAKVDRICTGFDRRAQLGPVACGAEQFRFFGACTSSSGHADSNRGAKRIAVNAPRLSVDTRNFNGQLQRFANAHAPHYMIEK